MKAAETLKTHLKAIAQWQWQNGGRGELSPTEQQLIKDFGIKIELPITWLEQESDVDQVVQIEEQFILLTHDVPSIFPVDAKIATSVMSCFADETYCEINEGQPLTVHLLASAPDVETAVQVEIAIITHIAEMLKPGQSFEPAPPWFKEPGIIYEQDIRHGSVRREGEQLFVHFQFIDTFRGLPQFMRWLREQGLSILDTTIHSAE